MGRHVTLQRVYQYGSSHVVTIPQPIIHKIGWNIGDHVVVELLEDHTVRFRRATLEDLRMPRRPKMEADDAPSVPA